MIALLIVIVGIQFIRLSPNSGEAEGPNEIAKHYRVSAEIHSVLKQSCYDCHSNNTRYPWYTSILPVGWWLQSHINDGKRHLNPKIVVRNDNFARRATKADGTVSIVRINPDIENERKR